MIKKENYWIKKKRQLLEYQIAVFEREIKHTIKKRDRLVATRDKRIEVFGLQFKSIEDMNEAYIAGLITGKEYRWQRNAYWQVYDDRGAEMRLEWLESEKKKYEDQLAGLYEYIEELKREREKRRRRQEKRHNKRGYYKKTRERMAREQEERERERANKERSVQEESDN